MRDPVLRRWRRLGMAAGALLIWMGIGRHVEARALPGPPTAQLPDSVLLVDMVVDHLNRRDSIWRSIPRPGHREYPTFVDTTKMPAWISQRFLSRRRPAQSVEVIQTSGCEPRRAVWLDRPVVDGDASHVVLHSDAQAPEEWGMGSTGHHQTAFGFVRESGTWKLRSVLGSGPDAVCRVVPPDTSSTGPT